jgi:hypothetical protein
MNDTSFASRARPWLLSTAILVAVLAAGSAHGQPVQAVVLDLDHLKCYEVTKDPVQGSAIVDLLGLHFGREESCEVMLRAQFLCAKNSKATVNGVGAGNDPLGGTLDSDFLCYNLKCARNAVREVQILDQFGERTVTIRAAKMLCTPARNLEPPPGVGCMELVPGSPGFPVCGGFCAPGTTCQPFLAVGGGTGCRCFP